MGSLQASGHQNKNKYRHIRATEKNLAQFKLSLLCPKEIRELSYHFYPQHHKKLNLLLALMVLGRCIVLIHD